MTIAFPGESAEYRAARERLLEQEIELRRAMEAVAAARRSLPPGGVVPEDYVFHGAGGEARLSELFAPGRDSLAIYSFMFAETPCPSCTAFLDQLDGAAEHAARQLNLVAVAQAPIERVLAYAEERGWRRLRLLSSGGTTYNRDYHGESVAGGQM